MSEAGGNLSVTPQDIAVLRQQIAELAVAQAEGLNALMDYASPGTRYGHSPSHVLGRIHDLRVKILEAAARSLAVAEALAAKDER